MRKLLSLLVFFFGATVVASAQMTMSCCTKPAAATEAFAMLANDDAFVGGHDAPLPYTYQGAGNLVSYPTPDGKTAKARGTGRGGRPAGGPGVASRCLGTLQAILGHAKHKGLLAEHPTRGAKKLAVNKRTRRLSTAEIIALGKAMAYGERNGENPTALAVVRTLAP